MATFRIHPNAASRAAAALHRPRMSRLEQELERLAAVHKVRHRFEQAQDAFRSAQRASLPSAETPRHFLAEAAASAEGRPSSGGPMTSLPPGRTEDAGIGGAVPPAHADHEASDTGRIAVGGFSVAEVLEFLAFNKKTGTARIEVEGESIEIDLRKGYVVDFSSDGNPPELRLGQILIERGQLDREVLEDYLARHEGSSCRLGRGLRSERLVKQAHVCRALRFQVIHALARALQAEDVTIDYVPRSNPYGSVDLHCELTALLFEVAAFVDKPPAV